MLNVYLTGADASKETTGVGSKQNDVSKSLGGFISNTPVPNGEINGLFDLISLMTLETGEPQTLAVALVNDGTEPITSLDLKIVTAKEHVAGFEVAAVATDGYGMERIANRNSMPSNAQFHTADFYRAETTVLMNRWANPGEIFTIQPFGITVTMGTKTYWGNSKDERYNDTFAAIQQAFLRSSWTVKRISRRKFKIIRNDESIVTPEMPIVESNVTSELLSFSVYQNGATGSVTIISQSDEPLAPKGAIGLWIRRTILDIIPKSNEQLIEEYKRDVPAYESTTETVDFVFDYDIIPPSESPNLLNLVEGDNLRGVTITFNTSKLPKSELKTFAYILQGEISTFVEIFGFSSTDATAITINEVPIASNGQWLQSSYTFPDDKDFIILSRILDANEGLPSDDFWSPIDTIVTGLQ